MPVEYSDYTEEEGKEHPPEYIVTEEERAVEQRKTDRYLRRQATESESTRADRGYSEYIGGLLKGNWTQPEFSSSNLGYRILYSAYDQAQDKLYAVSEAGHLWRIDRDEQTPQNTSWNLINSKETLMGYRWRRSLDIINTDSGGSVFVRSASTGMQYSVDEGASWQWATASGFNFGLTWDDAAVQNRSNGQRLALLSFPPDTGNVSFTTDGKTYTPSSLQWIPEQNYRLKVISLPNSSDLYLMVIEKASGIVETYRMGADDPDFILVGTDTTTLPDIARAFGTYHDSTDHLYLAHGESVFYSNDQGNSWTNTRLNSAPYETSGDRVPRTVHPDNPAIIFRGYLDCNISNDFGASFSGTGHRLGWDMEHMKMYTKADGSTFHFIGGDFGAFMSYTPEDINSYISLNNKASNLLVYDSDASSLYETSFAATQDRGTRGFTHDEVSGTTEVRSTDGLRVTLANGEKSVWTWMYFGSIFHQPNFGYSGGVRREKNFTGNWWASCMVESPDTTEDAVYIGGYTQLKKFRLFSNSLISSNHPYQFNANISGFGYSKADRNRWYVSTLNGNFYYSHDGGNTFNRAVISGQAPTGENTWHKANHTIQTSQVDPNLVYYAGIGNRFFISQDGGQTFTNHATNLDVYRIRDFAVSPDDQFVFAACGTGGIWVYAAQYDRWYELFDEPIPNVDVTSVNIIAETNVVEFGTYGYGMLRFEALTPLTNIGEMQSSSSNFHLWPNPVSKGQETIQLTFTPHSPVTSIDLRDLQGRLIKKVAVTAAPGTKQTADIEIAELSAGYYLLVDQASQSFGRFWVMD